MWADGAGAVGAVVAPADCEFDMAVKKLTMKQLRGRTDRICSLIARNTYTTCATCGKKLAYKDRQWGHAFPRACLAMRWDKHNRVQCVRCNCYLNGNYGMYAHNIISTFGLDYFEACVKIYQDWLKGKIKAPKIAEMRRIYNSKLEEIRLMEKQLDKELIPKSWKPEK